MAREAWIAALETAVALAGYASQRAHSEADETAVALVVSMPIDGTEMSQDVVLAFLQGAEDSLSQFLPLQLWTSLGAAQATEAAALAAANSSAIIGHAGIEASELFFRYVHMVAPDAELTPPMVAELLEVFLFSANSVLVALTED